MANKQEGKAGEAGEEREPRGFGEHTRGLPGEYAHEQGWGLAEEERTRQAGAPQDTDGGTDYNYSAQDFGDDPVNMARVNASSKRGDDEARGAAGVKPQGKQSERK